MSKSLSYGGHGTELVPNIGENAEWLKRYIEYIYVYIIPIIYVVYLL